MLSIVIPTRNTRELTLSCLRALLDAPQVEIQGIVVDDASSDGTGDAICARFPEVAVLRNDAPESFTSAVNRGIAAASGDIVLILNSDTEVDAGALRRLLTAFDRDARLGIAGATLRYPDGSPQWSAGPEPSLFWFWAKSSGAGAALSRLPPYRWWRRSRSRRNEVDWVSGAAMAIRSQVLDTIGWFDTRFELYAQDLDLCVRARAAGWRVCLLPEVGVIHHHGASVSGDEPQEVAERHNPKKTWSDLLRWAKKRHGSRWARNATRAVAWGLRLRLLGRRLAVPRMPHDRRRWAHEQEVYRSALRDILRRTGEDVPSW